jgi:hypothetical protein
MARNGYPSGSNRPEPENPRRPKPVGSYTPRGQAEPRLEDQAMLPVPKVRFPTIVDTPITSLGDYPRERLRFDDGGSGVAPSPHPESRVPNEPPPVPLPISDPREPGIPGGPFTGPEVPLPPPRVPSEPTPPPPEQACECNIEVTPDISLGMYTGKFKLSGMITKPGPYVIYCVKGVFKFRHPGAGGRINPWQDVLFGTMQCGETIEFKAMNENIVGSDLVIGRWGSLECSQLVGVDPPRTPKPRKPGECTCFAFCLGIDENGQFEVLAECELEVLPADPYAAPPMPRTTTSGLLVVMTEGDPSSPVEWFAFAQSEAFGSGYVSIAPPCKAPAPCKMFCGDVHVRLIVPTDLAIAALDAGAPVVLDYVEVWSTLGQCGLIEVKITKGDDTGDPSSYLTSVQLESSDNGIQLFGGRGPCNLNSLDSCVKYFNDESDAQLDGSGRLAQDKLEEVWDNTCDAIAFERDTCLDPLFKYAMVRLCQAGWTISVLGSPYTDEIELLKTKTESYKSITNLAVPHCSNTVNVYGPTATEHRVIAPIKDHMRWFVTPRECHIRVVPFDSDSGQEVDTGRLMEAMQALGKFVQVEKYKKTIPQDKLIGTIEAINFMYNTWWSDVKDRDWRLVQQDRMSNTSHDGGIINSILDPRDKGAMDYLFQVVRHNNASGMAEWAGTGYDSNADTEEDSSLLLTPLSKTTYYNTSRRLSDVFVYWGHGSKGSLGGVKLADVSDQLRNTTGVVIFLGCDVGDTFGHSDYDATGAANKAARKTKDYFPNASVKIGSWGKGGLLQEPNSVTMMRTFARELQLSMSDREITWAKLVERVNDELPSTVEQYRYVIGGSGSGEKIWQVKG